MAQRIAADCRRLTMLLDLGLGYLALERSTPTLSPGELQRLRLATQVVQSVRRRVCARRAIGGPASRRQRSALRGTRALKGGGQFAVRRRARSRDDASRGLARRCRTGSGRTRRHMWSIAVRQRARERRAIADATVSVRHAQARQRTRRARLPAGCGSRGSRATICMSSMSRFRSACFTTVTGVSGSGKSSLVSQALPELVADASRAHARADDDEEGDDWNAAGTEPHGRRISSKA